MKERSKKRATMLVSIESEFVLFGCSERNDLKTKKTQWSNAGYSPRALFTFTQSNTPLHSTFLLLFSDVEIR